MATRVRRRCSETSRSISIKISMAIGTTILIGPTGKRGDVGGGASMVMVVKVSIAVVDAPAAGVTDEGAIKQVDLTGCPEQVSATAALKVPTEVTVTVAEPAEPLVTGGIGLGATAKVKPGATAATLPVSETVCGLVTSVSTMVSVAVSVVAKIGR